MSRPLRAFAKLLDAFPNPVAAGNAMVLPTAAEHRQNAGARLPQPVLDARRNLHFFARATYLFISYRAFKMKTDIIANVRGDSPEVVDAAWAQQHDWGGQQIYKMAVDLRGFHLKGAQWLSARPDICPPEWVTYLSRLQDQCPPLSREQVEEVIQSELGVPISKAFCEWDDDPIGCASIAQVHRAMLQPSSAGWHWPWRRKRRPVAVKVQRPGAEYLMIRDLRNLRMFFSVPEVRKSLAWEPSVIFDQVEKETNAEFNFRGEAAAMDAAAAVMRRPPGSKLFRWLRRAALYTPPVAIPTSVPGMVSKRLLVMELLPGTQLSRLKRDEREAAHTQLSSGPSSLSQHPVANAATESSNDLPPDPQRPRLSRVERMISGRLLAALGKAYGRMLFDDGFGGVHADPHPGNILLRGATGFGGLQIGLVDWGQVKCFDLSMRLRLARMIEALCAAGDDAGRASSDEVMEAFRSVGVNWNSTKPLHVQRAAVAAVATEWYDTTPMPRPYSPDPTSPDYPVLQLGELTAFPTELLYFFRATQYLRAMTDAFGLQSSIAHLWRPHARRLLRRHGQDPNAWAAPIAKTGNVALENIGSPEAVPHVAKLQEPHAS